MDKIEIPFGAYDSETLGWTYTIPKGYTAKIEDGKIIVKKEETEDERIREEIIGYLKHRAEVTGFIDEDKDCKRWIAYLEKQKEQKPVGCADDVVEEAEKYTSKVSCGEYGVEVTEAYIAGVLSERNRGTGWSEEDEKILDELLDHCNTENATWYKWLKSLRPSWKPSEEQMKALESCFCEFGEGCPDEDELRSLYNDLKKLM